MATPRDKQLVSNLTTSILVLRDVNDFSEWLDSLQRYLIIYDRELYHVMFDQPDDLDRDDFMDNCILAAILENSISSAIKKQLPESARGNDPFLLYEAIHQLCLPFPKPSAFAKARSACLKFLKAVLSFTVRNMTPILLLCILGVLGLQTLLQLSVMADEETCPCAGTALPGDGSAISQLGHWFKF